MGDSDEDYDRRRGRDKFRRERNDYERGREDSRRRDQWDDRNRDSWSSRSREPYRREYDSRSRRDRSPYSRHDMSPPHKRMRGRDEGSYGFDMGPYGGGGPHHGPPMGWGPGPVEMIPPHHYNNPGPPRPELDYPTQPPVMTFKQFLGQQDDSISDQDAVKKYNDYKVDFQKQQINEFFLAHKDEEWFKLKYHPEDCERRQSEVRASLQNRITVFESLMRGGWLETLTVDSEKTDKLVKLLDAAVILLEGGTEADLKVLDKTQDELMGLLGEGQKSRTTSESKPLERSDSVTDQKVTTPKNKTTPLEETSPGGKKKKRRDRTERGYESGSDSSSGSGSSDSDEETETARTATGEKSVDTEVTSPVTEEKQEEKVNGESGDKRETAKVDPGTEKEGKISEEKEADTSTEPEPRPLHMTLSIFLRNLAPGITKQEVEAMCKKYPGFIRVALQDPQAERRYMRRGWVTFSRVVNIKEICWNLNNIRLRDCEMGAIVNRDIKQRVRPVNGIVNHKSIIKQDIKVAAKIVQNLDKKWTLWEGGEKADEEKHQQQSFGLVSRNPVLKNITDYLVDEGSYEEDELLGASGDEKKEDDVVFEKDPELLRVLDRMILYLRIVHSVDYYSGIEYPNEDEMPHRCGIMHARSDVPTSKIIPTAVQDWMNNFEQKVKSFTEMKVRLNDAEAAKLGRKNPESEVEKFILGNTQELAKDKWLCPLSGKKFKGPDFVRKHILNKHGEKVEEVKKEVTYFNNFLSDPKRPQLPEHPVSKHGGGGHMSHGPPGGFQQGPPPGVYGQGRGGFNQGYGPGPSYQAPSQYQGGSGYSRGGGREDFNRRGQPQAKFPSRSNSRTSLHTRSRSDPRPIIEYRDLDAPDDTDVF